MRHSILGLLLLSGCLNATAAPPPQALAQNGNVPPGAPFLTTAPPIPHLVVAQTGEDLGPLAGEDCAVNDDAGGETCFNATIHYDQLNCTGRAFLPLENHAGLRVTDRNGRVLQLQGAPQALTVRSIAVPGVACQNQMMMGGVVSRPVLADTGLVLGVHRRSELAVELR